MNKNILIIDDDPFTRQSLAKVLQAEDYQVFAAGTKQEAIDAHGEEMVNLLVCSIDCSAEGFYADELKWLARIDSRMPIIVLRKDSTLGVNPQSAVGDLLMERPLNLPVLLLKIAELISESHGERKARLHARQPLALPFGAGRDRQFCNLLQSRGTVPYFCDVSNLTLPADTPPGSEGKAP